MSASVTAEFLGGPHDGRRLEVDETVRRLRIPVPVPLDIRTFLSEATPDSTPSYRVEDWEAFGVTDAGVRQFRRVR
jgi:hypothetical protein